MKQLPVYERLRLPAPSRDSGLFTDAYNAKQTRRARRNRETDMTFETLYESAQRSELMLVDGGLCHWHLRRDGQLAIREIIATRKGAGSLMLERLKSTPNATSLFAKCPVGLEAVTWYTRKGFVWERMGRTNSLDAICISWVGSLASVRYRDAHVYSIDQNAIWRKAEYGQFWSASQARWRQMPARKYSTFALALLERARGHIDGLIAQAGAWDDE